HVSIARHEHMALVLARVVVDARNLLEFGSRRRAGYELDDRDLIRGIVFAVQRVAGSTLVAELPAHAVPVPQHERRLMIGHRHDADRRREYNADQNATNHRPPPESS